MRDEGFELDVVTYGIIIIVHCKARKYDEALELFREMEAKNCKPRIVSQLRNLLKLFSLDHSLVIFSAHSKIKLSSKIQNLTLKLNMGLC